MFVPTTSCNYPDAQLAFYFQGVNEVGVIVIAVIVVVGVVVAIYAYMQQQALTQAQSAYQQSLTWLKNDPINADLRERTLELGRAYSNLTLQKKGGTIFDEVDLMNDINAACATSAANQPKLAPQQPPVRSMETRLEMLSELRKRNAVTEAEYEEKRREILNEI